MKASKPGFTLAELVIVMGMSLLVILALIRLTTMAVSNHMRGIKSAAAQLEASLIFKVAEHNLAGATYLITPAAAGAPSTTLEACSNAVRGDTAAGAPVALNPGKPVGFLAFCQSGNRLYFHALPGCPAAYTCGTAPSMSFGSDDTGISASFKRSSRYSPVVEFSVAVNSKDHPVSRSTSYSLVAAVEGATRQPDAAIGSCRCSSPFVYACYKSNHVTVDFSGFLPDSCLATGPVGQVATCSARTLTPQAFVASCSPPRMLATGNQPCSCTPR